MNNFVDLGFAEEQDSWLLTNRYFPSKIGGLVAFLDLENLPESKEIACDYCNEPCIFLCQVYAGSEKNTNAFHRTIFVFICRNGKCCSINQSGNIKVFRSQLPQINQFYADTPPDETVESDAIVNSSVSLCRVCGCKGPMICGKCKRVHYCGQLHQKLDWKIHKKVCGNVEVKPELSEILFPEFEIEIEREENTPGKKTNETEKDAEKRRLHEYEEMLKSGNAGGMSDISEKDLQEFAETKEDKMFGKFKKAIESNPTQVLRYSRHFQPLWISDHGILNASQVPKCTNCSGKRTFEFQIMPQMLNELKNYELDYGIIAVYTCEKDCNTNGKYLTEFCYKQDLIKSDDDIDSDIKMKDLLLNKADDDDSNDDDDDDDDGQEKVENERVKIDGNKSSKPVQTKKPASSKNKKSNQVKKTFKESDDW